MKLRSVLLMGIVFAAVVVFAGNRVLSQEEEQEKQKGEADSATMEAWMKAGQPGEHHEHLGALIGQWNTHIKWRVTADAPWTESTGTAEFKWVMGGRYIVEKTESSMGEQKFEGMGILGYENTAKKHFST